MGDDYKRNVEQNVGDAINLLPKLATVRPFRVVTPKQPLVQLVGTCGLFVVHIRNVSAVLRRKPSTKQDNLTAETAVFGAQFSYSN
eukprot:3802086-Pyramimonas_sp.AAC.1